jgi:CDP-2,3-bis-(O-geranylgeranyl)-sn-glycerol synthase
MWSMSYQFLSFFMWCSVVNMSYNFLWYLVQNVSWIKHYERPLDLRCVFFDGKPLLGDSTTMGGFLWTGALGLVGEYLCPGLHFFVLAWCVFFGHALGSFIKRRLGLARGSFLPVVDHGDSIVLAGVVAYFYEWIPTTVAVWAVLLTYALTPLITFIGFRLHVRPVPL